MRATKQESEENARYLSSNKDDLSRKSDQPSALLCFDEARELLSPSNTSRDPGMRFLAFRRALRHQTRYSKEGDNKRFFDVLLDTTSRVSNFSPPRERDPSLKWLNAVKLFPPIYQIDTMDVFAGDAAAASTLSASLDAKSLFTLGRPLWSAMMQAKGRFDDVLGLARSKLLGGREPGDGGNEIGSLALLSYRINFYVVLHSLAEELVSGYLRYIVDMSDNRTFLRTLQPSEPILAHLSAREMHAHRDKRRDVIRTLYENTVKGTIHLGDIGEIVAALILLFAFDKSHTEQLPTPVRFSNFLASLFSNDKSLAIEQCMRDDEQMRRLWTDGYVFFNHFVRIAEKPTDETLRRAYQRGAAIFPPFGYKGCGIVIPVALPAENTMTYFIVQVKNRRDDSLTPGLRNEARDALKSAAMLLPSSSSAHVALLVSLRSKSGQGDMDIAYPAKRSTETGEVPPPRASQKNKKKKKKSSQIAGGSSGGGGAQPSTTPEYIWKDGELKRVVIVAVGMDLDLYPGLGFGSEPKEEPETVEIVGYLKSLLNCTSEMPTATQDSYYDHLATLG